VRPLPIRTRLAVAAVVLVALVLAVVGTVVYASFRSDLRHTVDVGLRSRAEALLEPDAAPVGSGSVDRSLVDPEDAFAQRYDAGGRVTATSPGMPRRAILDPASARAVTAERFLDVQVRTPEGEPITARALVLPDPSGGVLLIGASVEDQEEALQHLESFLTIGGLVSLALVTALLWRLLARALAPVDAMRAQAAAISASEPGRRLPLSAADDEISRLGSTLNAMLERLEEAIERERRFVRQASHELRTPLANLRAELDLALRRARTREELEAALRSASEETERLSRLAEDLLVLARTEGGRLPVRREPTDLAGVVHDAAEAFRTRAATRGIALEVDASAPVDADIDPARLAQAVGNLVENAIRETPSGGHVAVSAVRADGRALVEVRDTGRGFPPAVLARAFETPAPDAASTDGAGLGLAIVRAVADAHGGTVSAANTDGGAVVRLEIPLGRSVR